jgi:uncharacterized membrane protein HdeD (DUF308 family)
MPRIVCMTVGSIVISMAFLMAVSGWFARIEGPGELRYLIDGDILTGLLFGIAMGLWRLAFTIHSRWTSHVLTLTACLAIWLLISGILIWEHIEQVRVRSSFLY